MPLPSQRREPQRLASGAFTVLTVCTGNICRSPQAEQLLRSRLPSAIPGLRPEDLLVGSAGSMGMVGSSMDPRAREHSVRLGVLDADDHRARRLSAEHIEGADLVLGLSREHRSAAVTLAPTALRRTFTLIELARVLEAMAGGSVDADIPPFAAAGPTAFLRSVVAAAARVRGQVPPPAAPGELDVVDPYRLAPEVYRASADAVENAVDRLAAALRHLAETA